MSNYYPPLRVDSSVPDDIIRHSWRDLVRQYKVIGKIEDNGIFKTVYFDEEEPLDDAQDSLWVYLDFLEKHGSLMIFKDNKCLETDNDDYHCYSTRGDWCVDGMCNPQYENYEIHYLYKATYLDSTVKGIRREDMPEVSQPVEVSVIPKKPKKSWFSRLFR
jgi:hypothetical protein